MIPADDSLVETHRPLYETRSLLLAELSAFYESVNKHVDIWNNVWSPGIVTSDIR